MENMTICSVLSHNEDKVNSYELLGDAILGTNLHFNEEYIATYIRWLSVNVYVETFAVPPSTLIVSCTVITTVFIIITIWSREPHTTIIDTLIIWN